MKIILHKTRRKRPPNPVKAAVEMTDHFTVLINRVKKDGIKSEIHWDAFALLEMKASCNMLVFVKHTALLDYKPSPVSFQFG